MSYEYDFGVGTCVPVLKGSANDIVDRDDVGMGEGGHRPGFASNRCRAESSALIAQTVHCVDGGVPLHSASPSADTTDARRQPRADGPGTRNLPDRVARVFWPLCETLPCCATSTHGFTGDCVAHVWKQWKRGPRR